MTTAVVAVAEHAAKGTNEQEAAVVERIRVALGAHDRAVGGVADAAVAVLARGGDQ